TFILFFFSSRRRHTRFSRDWSSDVCSSDLALADEIIFTNSNQLSYMLGYCDLPSEAIEDVRKRSVISHHPTLPALFYNVADPDRSEERRVGKECRSRRSREE